MGRVRTGLIIAAASAALGGALGGALVMSGGSRIAAASAAPSPASGGHHGPHGPGARRDHGLMGQVTGISGATLTLRTIEGTLTVTTTSSTTYSKEGTTISFGDIRVGDVVRVRPQGASSGSTAPPTSVTAAEVSVVMGHLGGRVQSVSGDTITVVLFDGRLGTITTSGSTRYISGKSTEVQASDVKAGSFIEAAGTLSGVDALAADVVRIVPAGGLHPHRP